jgi:hypothetical protein
MDFAAAHRGLWLENSAKAMESAKRTVPLSKASWEYAQKAGAK